jgi:hypothetical protein
VSPVESAAGALTALLTQAGAGLNLQVVWMHGPADASNGCGRREAKRAL